MIVDRRRIIGIFAVFALVLMRLVIGWHFFGEGAKKLKYDEHSRTLRLDFSAEGFLNEAKGPLAVLYHGHAPNVHGWRDLLAVPKQNVRLTDAELADQSHWMAEYEQRRSEAEKKHTAKPVEFPRFAPYQAWANRINEDWKTTLDRVKAIPSLSEEQKKKADAVYEARLDELSNYLADEEEGITAYQHELWRLAEWRNANEAGGVPYHQQRITAKASETAGQAAAWVGAVRALDAAYEHDLANLLSADQRNDAKTASDMANALTSTNEWRLSFVNHVVTWITVGVGVCLLLGFFTRLASLVGALFLLSVIASQPFWLPDAHETMHQAIECAGLLVLAGTRAGRWCGLDYVTYLLFNRSRHVELVQEDRTKSF